MVPAQAFNPVLARQDDFLLEFVGDEPVPEFRIICMDIPRRVDQMRIDSVPFRYWAAVIALLAESQQAAGYRHGNTIGGKICDQREDVPGEIGGSPAENLVLPLQQTVAHLQLPLLG
ncbi:hypothetical protein QFZ35_003123 [Arthrobacter ulcerisalmonis]|nr:hypothetical protein [Arthrobacter ulcerisalmonis]